MSAVAVDLKQCRVVVAEGDAALVKKMAKVLSEDVERVTGVLPVVDVVASSLDSHLSTLNSSPSTVILATVEGMRLLGLSDDVDVRDIQGGWEQFKIVTKGKKLYVVGSDARGTAYGTLHVSERIGVSPWYWFADVPVQKKPVLDYQENYT